jgi:hypothetical protein
MEQKQERSPETEKLATQLAHRLFNNHIDPHGWGAAFELIWDALDLVEKRTVDTHLSTIEAQAKTIEALVQSIKQTRENLIELAWEENAKIITDLDSALALAQTEKK